MTPINESYPARIDYPDVRQTHLLQCKMHASGTCFPALRTRVNVRRRHFSYTRAKIKNVCRSGLPKAIWRFIQPVPIEKLTVRNDAVQGHRTATHRRGASTYFEPGDTLQSTRACDVPNMEAIVRQPSPRIPCIANGAALSGNNEGMFRIRRRRTVLPISP